MASSVDWRGCASPLGVNDDAFDRKGGRTGSKVRRTEDSLSGCESSGVTR